MSKAGEKKKRSAKPKETTTGKKRQSRYSYDPLEDLRGRLKDLILERYVSVYQFCQVHDFEKSTLSRLINGKRIEFQVKTLMEIAAALGQEVQIRFKP